MIVGCRSSEKSIPGRRRSLMAPPHRAWFRPWTANRPRHPSAMGSPATVKNPVAPRGNGYGPAKVPTRVFRSPKQLGNDRTGDARVIRTGAPKTNTSFAIPSRTCLPKKAGSRWQAGRTMSEPGGPPVTRKAPLSRQGTSCVQHRAVAGLRLQLPVEHRVRPAVVLAVETQAGRCSHANRGSTQVDFKKCGPRTLRCVGRRWRPLVRSARA